MKFADSTLPSFLYVFMDDITITDLYQLILGVPFSSGFSFNSSSSLSVRGSLSNESSSAIR